MCYLDYTRQGHCKVYIQLSGSPWLCVRTGNADVQTPVTHSPERSEQLSVHKTNIQYCIHHG